MSTLNQLFLAFGLVVFILGVQTILFVPLAVYYEWWKKRFLGRWSNSAVPFVSVIVPAFNEENTIAASVTSILRSTHPCFEVIVVNDGSTDRTEEKLSGLIVARRIVYISKPNGGKASALNRGIEAARGEIILFTDADSFFRPDTISNMVRWFADPSVHAVSGNDEPVRPSTALQKLLVITTHIGSGFVRRALSVLRVLPVISGNLGAVRKEYLDRVGGFSELWGEDLDLTFKLHKTGARILFDPEARVLCEVPATIPELWRQRVRWMRSFLKICHLHKDLFINWRFAPFSLYLPINWLNMVVVPLLQIAVLGLLLLSLYSGRYRFDGFLEVTAYLGVSIFFGVSLLGIILDKSYHHLRYLPLFGWLIIPFSYFYNAVLAYSIYREAGGATEEWGKIERRGFDMRFRMPTGMKEFTAWLGASMAAAVVVLFLSLPGSSARNHESAVALQPTHVSVAVATHFDAWRTPEDAVRSIVNRSHVGVVNTVGIGAGRVEWNFFRWDGHGATWSNDQKATNRDMLEDAVHEINSRGKKAVAILDFYAPTYIRENPAAAAIDADGHPSSEQVCFVELTEGAYGREVIAMATYLAKHYELEGISLTELEYNRYCYDDRCLQSFKSDGHASGWPHKFLSSAINRESRTLGEWRSRLMARFLRVIADSVHRYGKRLYVDVPVHERTLENEGLQSGLYYPALLQFADALIVWDYFYLDGRPPSSSRDVAGFFTSRYDPERIVISIGLWGEKHPVSADELSAAVRSALLGGARYLWITPNHLITENHWKRLVEAIAATDTDRAGGYSAGAGVILHATDTLHILRAPQSKLSSSLHTLLKGTM